MAKFCNRPGCPETVARGTRLCARHQARAYRQQDVIRASSTERGYDADWRRFRRRFLSQNPLCRDCGEHGRLTVAAEVHHVEKLADGGARLDPNNCMALCKPCHSKRTMKGE